MNLFNLISKISLDDSEFNKGLNGAEKNVNAFKTGMSKMGEVASTVFKATAVAVGTATAGVVALTKASVDSYAEYEQLVGGVETLFGKSADTILEYSKNAYKNAGVSANQYLDQMMSFSASLIQSLGGDTKKAAEVGNMAIEDMSDNANKMGTSIELIQNAYQGFAKSNYTMLDNLKLG